MVQCGNWCTPSDQQLPEGLGLGVWGVGFSGGGGGLGFGLGGACFWGTPSVSMDPRQRSRVLSLCFPGILLSKKNAQRAGKELVSAKNNG